MTFGIDEIHRIISACDRAMTEHSKTASVLYKQHCNGDTFARFAAEYAEVIRKLKIVLDTKKIMEVE